MLGESSPSFTGGNLVLQWTGGSEGHRGGGYMPYGSSIAHKVAIFCLEVQSWRDA